MVTVRLYYRLAPRKRSPVLSMIVKTGDLSISTWRKVQIYKTIGPVSPGEWDGKWNTVTVPVTMPAVVLIPL